MKQNTSFSSLPTGAHLHLGGTGDMKFVFLRTMEVVSDEVRLSLDGIKNELGVTKEKIEEGLKMKGKTKDLNNEIVEGNKEVGKESWVLNEADKLRKEMDQKVQKILEEKFKTINVKFEEILEKECGPSASALGMSAKEWLIKQIRDIKSLPVGETENQKAALQPLIKALNTAGDEIMEKEGFGKKLIGIGKKLIGSKDIKTRVGDGFGVGLTALYIGGLVAGADKNGMWYGGLIAGGAAALAPGVTTEVFKGADWALDTLGQGVEFTFTHFKNALVGAARLDAGQMWDGQTDVNEARDKYLEAFYKGGILRPGADENGNILIDDAMHNRILNPGEGMEFTPEQCSQAAQFCASVMNPLVFLEGKNFPETNLEEIRKHATWSPETIELMQRRFATQETALIWNYFMLHADKTKELTPFARAFEKAFEEKKNNPLTQEVAKKKLQAMYPGITKDLENRTPEGIASFMRKGGLEDVFVLFALLMGVVYTAVGTMTGVRKMIDKAKEMKNRTPKEKYDIKRNEAKKDLVELFTKKNPVKYWKKILTALGGMSILNAVQRKNLLKLSSAQKKAVILNMRNNLFLTKDLGEKLSGINETQDVFWKCVKGVVGIDVAKKRGPEMGKEGADTKAKIVLTSLRDASNAYISFQKDVPSSLELKLVKKGSLSAFWKNNPGKKKDWETILKDLLGKQSKIFAAMKTLGVTKNEIELCKDTSKKDGERRTFVLKTVIELLSIGGNTTGTK